MNSQSHSGQNLWNEFILFGCSLLNMQECIYCKSEIGTFDSFLTDFKVKKIDFSGYSDQVILRIAFGRPYYGCLQLIIDKLHLNRENISVGIHKKVKLELVHRKLYDILNLFKKLAILRIWADYRPVKYEHNFNITYLQGLTKHSQYISKIIQLIGKLP